MVPNGWDFVKLDDIAIKVMVGIASAATHAYTDSGIRMLRNLNIKDGWIDDSDILHIDNDYEVQHKNKRLKTGDILTVRTGYPGLSAVVPSIYENAQCFTSLVTRLDQAKALPDYVCRFINSEYGKKFIVSGEAGGAQKNVNAAMLKKMPIPLPPLPEQRKIAQILSTWDRGIATTEKLIDASKQQKKALMQQLLTGKKRLIDPETGKAFQGEWEEVKLGDLGKTFTGLTGKTKEHFGKGSKYIPYINIFRNSSVDMNALELVDVLPNEKQNLVKYGDIFFTTSSETPEEVGMSSVILEEIDESVYLNSFCFGFRPHNFNRVKPEFICYLLRSEKVRRSISLLAQGATRYNLSKTQLLKITLNIPSLGEQQKIASVLTTADKEIELLEAKLAHFKQEKKALMQQLLTGKRRVKVEHMEEATC
ncbi:restriction endonuclease subunit S (plasmid) [Vibrio campbellii]|uniref:restriction endonuclease subunit S n=1 Tax=Vibrio campbellii TaxID=680 RepID=UPI001F0853C5|nr:restriction endonuclease subunit S [Vibrio campbellii]UMM06994.1 restriction endonuclease subunit S [Vibrio campbellii]